MIWNLLLAHLLADFPLQPMWLVRSKQRTWGLAVHGGVHFLATLLLVGAARATIWPQVLALAAFHFAVDVVKYRLGISRPLWSIVSYFVDQAVHVLSFVVIAGWIASIAPGADGLFAPTVAIYACGYLIATHVWYVTEKTIAQDQAAYRDEVEATLWPRMLTRAGLLTGLLYFGSVALPAADRSLVVVGIGLPMARLRLTAAALVGMPGAGHRLPAAMLGLRVTNSWLPVTDFWLPVTDFWLPVTDFCLRVTGFWLPVAGFWLPFAAAIQPPYQKDLQWRRALITDLLVTLLATAFIRLAATSI